jgi:hypothetical protein
MRTKRAIAIAVSCAGLLLLFSTSAPAQQVPARGGPRVEIRGTIQEVRILPGQGTPYLVVSQAKKPVRVYLGSMRYLIQQNFNPKMGQEVSVTGFQVPDGVVAATVALTGSDRVLKLRDENGRPLWRGGWRRGQQR